jgi:hypothetical protein
MPITFNNVTLWSGLTISYPPTIPSDAYWNYVTFLQNFEAPQTAFVDGSNNNAAVTAIGSPIPNYNTPFTGVGGSVRLGSANYLTFPANAAYNLSNGNFTFEAWINMTSLPSTNPILSWGSGSFATFRITATGINFEGSPSSSFVANFPSTITTNTWYHVALVRSSSTTVTAYLNGVAGTPITSLTSSNTYGDASNTLSIGFKSDPQYYNGYISNWRLVKGVSVYSSNFTPSTLPLPATQSANVYGNPSAAITSGQTSLLMNFSNINMQNNTTFADISAITATPTVSGSPYYAGLTPFTNTYPGSIYFRGGGFNSFTMPTNAAYAFGTGNFTVEFWMYVTTASTTQAIFDLRNPDTANLGFDISLVSSQLTVNTSGTRYIQGTTTLSNNTWYHVALSRTSTTSMTLYLNGIQEGSTYTTSQNFTNQIPRIAFGVNGYFTGYLSNIRMVKGVGVYTANFTPSTQPLPATQSANTYGNPSAAITGTQTSLLIPGTNAGFQDLSLYGQRITNSTTTTTSRSVVGTQIYKFGTQSNTVVPGSGLGGTQFVLNDVSLQLGVGDFTIEGWLYSNISNTPYAVWNLGTNAPTGWVIEVNASNQLVWYSSNSGNTPAKTSTDTIPASTWTYFAITRSGTNLYMFINGTLQGSAVTDSSNYNQTVAMNIGANRSGTGPSFNGYFDDLRITKGIARYTASFSAPTAAFPTS